MTDAISRSMIIRALTANIFLTEDEIELMKEVIDMIETAPPLDVQPVVHARWEYVHPCRLQCVVCAHYIDVGDDKNFCPNCGARMDGETE